MLFILLNACLTPSAESPTITENARFEDRVLAADAVLEGVVTRVEYARSAVGEGLMSVPHTFVTWQVETTFKGEVPRELTLRFVGGRSEDGRILRVSDIPDFEVGDRDILLVDGAPSGCPLVRCAEGRFRVFRDQVTTDGGALMTIAPSGGIRPGPGLDLPRLSRVKIGEVEIPQERELVEPVEGFVGLRAADFRAELGDAVKVTEDDAMLPIISQDPRLPFTLPAPSFGGPKMPDMDAVHRAVPIQPLPPKN